MKLIAKLTLVLLMFIAVNSYALEEPPGSQSIEESEIYWQQLKAEQARGIIYMDPGIEESWNKAVIFIPESNFSKRIKNIKFTN